MGLRAHRELRHLRAANDVQNPLIAQGAALNDLAPVQRYGGHTALNNSKLKPPLPAAACIDRPALITRVDAASRSKLVLLSAPMGSGKTTLLTQWYKQVVRSRPVAWLSLDETDNEPVRFYSYLIAAVRSAMPGFDAYIPRGRDTEETTSLDPVGAVVNESFGRLEQRLIIVIDDSQWLTAPALNRALDLLLNRSPENVHWILSGRCVPDVNTSALRLNDRLVTIDAAALSFDSTAIVQLGRKLCGRTLSGAEAECIKARTEGWIAGVKLALLAAADPKEPCDTLQQFAGSHCEVARYLGDSVLKEQSEEIRDFLIASSVVDRMTGELCNALLGISHSQALLEHLERSQLFVQPLDSHAHWYRYHTLFRDFLRSCVRRDAARIPVLHERASRWFAEHQLYEEALRHAFEATNSEWRNELVARCAGTWLRNGEIADVIGWCEKLPRKEVMGSARICMPYLSALILARRFDDAAAALREVQACAAGGRTLGVIHLRMLQMMLTILSDSGSETSHTDLDSLHSEEADGFLSGTLLTLQAYAMLRRHQFEVAWRLAMRARDAMEHVSIYGFGYADIVASLAERAQGDFKAALQRRERLFAMVRSGRRNPAWVNAATVLAHTRYEENRLTEAEALCTEVLPLLSVASTIENFTVTYITLARIKTIAGRARDAFQLLDYLHSVLESGCHRRFLAQVCAEKIRLCLSQSDMQRAHAVALDFSLPQLAESGEWLAVPSESKGARVYEEAWERFGSAYVSLLLHEQKYNESRVILTALRNSAHAVGYVYREITLEAALAECNWRAGDQDAAFEALNRGLALTRGHGFTRCVFDETTSLMDVINAARRDRKLHHLFPSRYACKPGGALGDERTRYTLNTGAKRKAAVPLEPLTDRELDMLKLLAQGLSNQEISVQSQIALSTAKWHLKNVFAKLDVMTRTGAIARARELQLID